VSYTGRSRVTPSTVARLETGEQTAHRIADLVTESFTADEVAVDMCDAGGARWRVALHFRSAPDEDAVCKLVAAAAGPEAASALSFAQIAPADWVRESLVGLKPVAAGRFIVHGAHDRARIAVNRIGIEVEAALAFGTGHHGTTRGCLLALDRLCRSMRRPMRAPPPARGRVGVGVAARAATKMRPPGGTLPFAAPHSGEESGFSISAPAAAFSPSPRRAPCGSACSRPTSIPQPCASPAPMPGSIAPAR
jgi:ribosomal protein L11 methyltransferase